MWNTLKEKFQGNERIRKSLVTQCLYEFSELKQKETESIEGYYDRFNDLI